MTSPVDTSVKYFTSASPGAPVLNGTAGALIGVLDACLVNGYDLKTLTSLVAAGGVMTATFTGTHGSKIGQVVLVDGVTGGPTGFAGANGEQKVTARAATTGVSWATALPDGTYTGTITLKIASVGWAKPFSGTNLAVYKSSDLSANGHMLRVDDTDATNARVVGYETMLDINTGAGLFPTATQMPNTYWGKSVSANTVPAAWVVVATSTMFYFCAATGNPVSPIYRGTMVRGFGDVNALRPGGDVFATALSCSSNSDVSSQSDGAWSGSGGLKSFFPRSYTGLGSSEANLCLPYTGGGNGESTSGADVLLGNFPSPVDGSLKLSKKFFSSAVGAAPRAELPGLFHVPQAKASRVFATGDLVPGSGFLAGRRLMAVVVASNTYSDPLDYGGVVFFDITGPW